MVFSKCIRLKRGAVKIELVQVVIIDNNYVLIIEYRKSLMCSKKVRPGKKTKKKKLSSVKVVLICFPLIIIIFILFPFGYIILTDERVEKTRHELNQIFEKGKETAVTRTIKHFDFINEPDLSPWGNSYLVPMKNDSNDKILLLYNKKISGVNILQYVKNNRTINCFKYELKDKIETICIPTEYYDTPNDFKSSNTKSSLIINMLKFFFKFTAE